MPPGRHRRGEQRDRPGEKPVRRAVHIAGGEDEKEDRAEAAQPGDEHEPQSRVDGGDRRQQREPPGIEPSGRCLDEHQHRDDAEAERHRRLPRAACRTRRTATGTARARRSEMAPTLMPQPPERARAPLRPPTATVRSASAAARFLSCVARTMEQPAARMRWTTRQSASRAASSIPRVGSSSSAMLRRAGEHRGDGCALPLAGAEVARVAVARGGRGPAQR